MKYYMYVFVMPGLSAEQVAVQAAHAAFEAGYEFYSLECVHPALVLMSANISAVMKYLTSIDVDYVAFEEDMFNNPVITAVATQPVEADSLEREKLSLFSTLRFKNNLTY